MFIDTLLDWYTSTTYWENLAKNSKILYTQMLSVATRYTPNKPVVDFTYSDADELFKNIRDTEGQYKAVYVCKVLRRVWNKAIRVGYVNSNPFSNMNLPSLNKRTQLWTTKQIKKFNNTSIEQGLYSLSSIFTFCFDLCQRPGDMINLTHNNIVGNQILFTQQKTGKQINIVLPQHLLQLVKGNNKYLFPNDGDTTRYSYKMFNKRVNDIKQLAHLPKSLQVRDLRRTGLTILANLGCTEDELRAISGLTSRDELSTYVMATTKLSENAMNKRFKK